MNGIIYYVVSCEWLLSLSIIFSWVVEIWMSFKAVFLPSVGYLGRLLLQTKPLILLQGYCKSQQQHPCLKSLPERVECYVVSFPWDLQEKLWTGILLGFSGAWAKSPLLIHFTESISPVRYSSLCPFLSLPPFQELTISSTQLVFGEGLYLQTITLQTLPKKSLWVSEVCMQKRVLCIFF